MVILTECCRDGEEDEDGLGQWEITGDHPESYVNKGEGETQIITDWEVKVGKKWGKVAWQQQRGSWNDNYVGS